MQVAKQLELHLWQNLKAAFAQPQEANWQQLWQDLEQAIASVPRQQQLQVAAEAIFQIVEIYAQRAHLILATLEIRDNSACSKAYRRATAVKLASGPILPDDFLAGLMRQTMSLDLSDLMEAEPYPKQRSQSVLEAESSLAAPVDKLAVLAMVEQLSVDETLVEEALLDEDNKQTALSLAHEENVSAWVQAIAQQMQQHNSKATSLLRLQQALGMPLVELWLGLLLGEQDKYEWETGENFYREASEIWLSSKCAQTTKATGVAF